MATEMRKPQPEIRKVDQRSGTLTGETSFRFESHLTKKAPAAMTMD